MTVSLHIFCGQVKIKLSKNRPHRIAYKPCLKAFAYKVLCVYLKTLTGNSRGLGLDFVILG